MCSVEVCNIFQTSVLGLRVVSKHLSISGTLCYYLLLLVIHVVYEKKFLQKFSSTASQAQGHVNILIISSTNQLSKTKKLFLLFFLFDICS